jgi:hypothetical protein
LASWEDAPPAPLAHAVVQATHKAAMVRPIGMDLRFVILAPW